MFGVVGASGIYGGMRHLSAPFLCFFVLWVYFRRLKSSKFILSRQQSPKLPVQLCEVPSEVAPQEGGKHRASNREDPVSRSE